MSAEIRQLGKLRTLSYNEADLSLFREFCTLFAPSSGCMQLLREHDFAGMFQHKRVRPLDEFYFVWKDAGHEFVDKRLERQRKAAYDASSHFLDLLGVNVFPDKGDVEYLTMDFSSQPSTDELINRRDAINAAASEAYTELQKLLRLGRHVFRTVKDL
jgi:hypothetical protein